MYLVFEDKGLVSPNHVTRTWHVRTPEGNLLGGIRWYSHWRRYIFQSAEHTVFEHDCLREIADFIEAQTQFRKQARIKERRQTK